MAEIMDHVRAKINSRGTVGIQAIGRLFRIADDNGNWEIDLTNEFPKLLKDIGIQLSDEDVKTLATYLDKNGNGTICYEEFLREVAPPMNEERTKWVVKAFDSVDVDHSGVIDIKDLKDKFSPENSALVRAGKTSANIIMQNLLQNYDQNGDGKITKEEFIDAYREISPSMDYDEQFALMIRRAWNLPDE